jgi:iron complex transport system permease protein
VSETRTVSAAPAVGRSTGTGGPPVAVLAPGLVVALATACVASVVVGSRAVPLEALADPSHPLHAITTARLERTALALVVGAALGLAGALMQGLTRNPLADPGILGVNAGASFAMVLAISVAGVSDLGSYIWFAFAGAAAATLLVHGIAALAPGGASPVSLAIAGAALTAAVTSWTSGVLLVDRATIETFRLWQVGTVGGRGLDVVATGLPFLLVALLLAIPGARLLDALALGDDVARGLGGRTTRDRLVVGLAIVLLAGTATALAGPIAFVGLVVPHAVRALAGPGHARLLPLSALAGALLVVVADTAGRVVLPPAEVQVGIMTAVVGAPAFLLLVRRSRGSRAGAR